MHEFTLLTMEQIFEDDKLNIFKKIGPKCAATDFANILGVPLDDEYLDNDQTLKGRIGDYFTQTSETYFGDVIVVTDYGEYKNRVSVSQDDGIRPVFYSDNFIEISANAVIGNDGVLEVEYGEYPQYAASLELSKILEEKYVNKTLNKTGKTYTTNIDKEDGGFKPKENTEYEYKGKKYVRMIYDNYCSMNSKILSNGCKYNIGDHVWVEVSPIKWYVEKKEKLLLSKTSLVAGIRFCDIGEYFGDFNKTEVYHFLNTYFVKDIIINKIRQKKHQEQEGKRKGIKISSINIDKIKEVNEENQGKTKENNQKKLKK